MFRILGILEEGEKLPWHIDSKETKSFCNAWTRIYDIYRNQIRRQKECGKDVSYAEKKLKEKHFICPDLYKTIFGGIVPGKRKNARKRT